MSKKVWTGAFVAHECKKCKRVFIAEDYTNTKDQMPKWRYCPYCAKELGIVYEEQTPAKNRTPEQNEKLKRQVERLKKYQFSTQS